VREILKIHDLRSGCEHQAEARQSSQFWLFFNQKRYQFTVLGSIRSHNPDEVAAWVMQTKE